MTSDYKPVPVEVAREISKRYAKSMVVILAYDREHEQTHTTTYGDMPAEKEAAADVGDRCAKLICQDGFDRSTSFEDFRYLEQAKRAKKIELLTTACTAADHAIGSLLAERTGISDELLSSVRASLQEALAAEDGKPKGERR